MKKSQKYLSTLVPFICLLILVFTIYFGYILFFGHRKLSFLEDVESNNYASITHYAIYGIHLNIQGNINIDDEVNDMKLILSNGKKELELPFIYTNNGSNYTFKTSHYINEGIVLDNLPKGEYYLLIKVNNKKYYSVQNKTTYDNLEYYTITNNKKNNKINIEWNTYDECPTLRFSIKEEKLPSDVYDITLDPGHDAVDPGMTVCYDGKSVMPIHSNSCSFGELIKESDLNLVVSLKLKELLERDGYKVSITRDDYQDEVDVYAPMGSATMANDTHSKLNLAIHHNSLGSTVNNDYLGFEIYIANDTETTFAETLLNNLKKSANAYPSHKEKYAIIPGIYQRYFSEEEIGSEEYYWNTSMIYYYNIREVGGISTHAAQDGIGRPEYPKNEHYLSNNTAEPYLLELGYMDNLNDLKNIMDNPLGYAEGIKNAINEYLKAL